MKWVEVVFCKSKYTPMKYILCIQDRDDSIPTDIPCVSMENSHVINYKLLRKFDHVDE